MTNAIHTNHFSLMSGNGHIRLACGEQLRQDIPPIPHTVLLVPAEAAVELIDLLGKTIAEALKKEVTGF